jgi:hypothetical protein
MAFFLGIVIGCRLAKLIVENTPGGVVNLCGAERYMPLEMPTTTSAAMMMTLPMIATLRALG